MNPKVIIIPIQQWLLSQGRCFGCGRLLNHGHKKTVDGTFVITCQCQRIFIQDKATNSYRQALFNEMA